jgi:ABC-type transport system involved in multi-copper enzyme maturation permease subunit
MIDRPDFTDSEYRAAVTAPPSAVTADEPSLARILAVVGLFAAVLGVAAVVANQFGPRIVSTPAGVFLAAIGFGLLLYHAFRDTEIDIRRMYGLAGVVIILGATVVSLLPGRADDQAKLEFAYYFLPWGAALAAIGILFLVAFTRAETDESLRTVGLFFLWLLGVNLTIAPILVMMASPNLLLGQGPVLALLGLLAFGGAFAHVDLSGGKWQVAARSPGSLGAIVFAGSFAFFILRGGTWRVAATRLGILGAVIFAGSIAFSIFPTVLHDGPAALKRPNQSYDAWKVLGRVAMILLFLGGSVTAWRSRSWPGWVRGATLVGCLAATGIFLYASFDAPLEPLPPPFLVPHGIILGAIGLAYLGVSVGAVSDLPFVVLTRRELAAYFCSPIAYIVLAAVTVIGGVGYSMFRGYILRGDLLGPAPKLEPILASFAPGSVIGPIIVPFLVAGLTMRLFSEEKRSGTLDVLLTAPVSDAAVIASKFLACWLFFVLCWVPPCLLLLGLRVENAQPFDFRPILSFFLAVGVTGVEFVAIGLFFSSLTRNQVVAAFLTLSVIAAEWAMYLHQYSQSLTPILHTICDRLSYWILWESALAGQLPVRDCVLHLSIGVFFLFLTAKSLEARKWT